MKPPEHAEPGTGRSWQVVCFHVGAQEYALDILRVKEVINPVAITAVPHAPAFLEGVIELRGAVLGIMDLRKRLAAPVSAVTLQHKYVIVLLDGRPLAMIVDRVTEVRRVDPGQVKPAPMAGAAGHCVAGLVRHDERVILVLDADRLLAPDERAALA